MIPKYKVLKRFLMVRLGLIFVVFCYPAYSYERSIRCGGNFNDFMSSMEEKAISVGISVDAIDKVLKYVNHSPEILRLDQNQTAFRLGFLEFSNRAINKYRLQNGEKKLNDYKNFFLKMKSKYGVSPEVIVAIWALESDFGKVQGNYHTLSALATLAHNCRRTKLFKEEFISAVELVSRGVIDAKTSRGAWAGEVGNIQMLPSDILLLGRDGDGDGSINMTESVYDSLETAFAFFESFGWEYDGPWLEEVRLPENFRWEDTGLGRERTVSEWKLLGAQPRGKKFLGEMGQKAAIIVPQGRKGPKFIVYENFRVFLKWNNSFIYAVTAAYLATRLSGAKTYSLEKAESIIDFEKIQALQVYLKSIGEDVGDIDGILGAKTRDAVRKIQLFLGLDADSWPTNELLQMLKI